jgi:hypothetical protein
MTRTLDQLTGGITGAAGSALLGAITGHDVLTWAGVVGAIVGAVFSWIVGARARLAEEQRRQLWSDFVVAWRIEQAKQGKLDPTLDQPPPHLERGPVPPPG